MNPPSALQGAMSRDRKPFTYTPGGLDLSEIKSQRMAQRLMRNAMNPGVPEVAVNTALPSSIPTMPVALPNYNCLPVQVFPAMPANPKTLLRSRSNPNPRNAPEQSVTPSAFVNKTETENRTIASENKATYSQQLNFNRPSSMYEYCAQHDNAFNPPKLNYRSDEFTINSDINAPASPFVYIPVPAPISTTQPGPALVLPEISYEAEFCEMPKSYNGQFGTNFIEDKYSAHNNGENNGGFKPNPIEDTLSNLHQNESVNVIADNMIPTHLATKNVQGDISVDKEQREVKVIKKQVIKETKSEEQNGKENGDANDENVMTVKLPAKKSAAKTETKVEVAKRVLPDGSTEEVKTTTTTTTIDGRTEIKTKTETKITPKAEEYEEQVEEEEEEDEEEEEAVEVQQKDEKTVEEPKTASVTKSIAATNENGDVVTEENSETTISKKVVVIQESEPTEEVEEEEIEETEVDDDEPITVTLKNQTTPEPKVESKKEESEDDEREEEDLEPIKKERDDEEDEQVEDKEEKIVEIVTKKEVEGIIKEEPKADVEQKDTEQQEDEEEEYEEAEEEKREDSEDGTVEMVKSEENAEEKETVDIKKEESLEETEKEETISNKSENKLEKESEIDEHVIPVKVCSTEETKPKPKEEIPTEKPAEYTIPIREPSIPLDKVEDIEIKPIGITPIITKTHTEDTEIITNRIDPSMGLSRKTEYNKVENIVTVNRTTKILDQNYEHMTQQGIPTVKTYFPPPNIDKISTSPIPSRPYQSVYAPESTTERRHSLLLERLSMERQMPPDIYQYSNQLRDQAPYQDEPQSEILTVSNVKPSSITNQQWYQQTSQTQNLLYNNVTSTPTPLDAHWTQPKSPQPQHQYQPQPQYQSPTQPQYQTPNLPQFQRGTTPQPQFTRGTTPQPQFQKAAAPQPQFQPTYTEPMQDKTPTKNYSTFPPTPTWQDNKQNQYSYVSKDSTQSYQKSTFNSTSQQYCSDYVPPPWEQDSSYTSVNNTSEKYYREIPQTNTFSPNPPQGWTPAQPSAKFTKPAPIAYVPPAPNQSFVKTGSKVEPPRQLPGRKTYYSEYERRYITVPESTYIPTETKFQPQPDPSPQYYYDNNEPTENEEPQWRRELREFTEKTTSQTTEQTNVPPPWEVDSKYAKTPSSTYTPTPTWSQTLRPQSYRKRSFESEFVSQEWPKTNSLGRGKPLSTMGKSLDGTVPERARGMSVDRYNPNNYQPPAEHPPVQSHTLTTPLPHASYHNPNVPAYHARASAEPREQPVNYQQRVYREARASPLQSRSFKYLQWITGTEN